MSSSNFQSILDAALDSYAKQTGIDLIEHPSANKLQNCRSPDDVLQILSDKELAFKDYRDRHHNLIDCVRPVLQVVYALAAVLGETAGPVPLHPTRAIFVSIDILLSAAIGVSTSYDALTDLFECVSNFLGRLRIYTTKISLSPTMSDVMVKIMVEVLSVFALATKQINQGRFKKFTKKLLGESEVEAVLQRLDRLTQEEARVTVAHTLEVVHGLFNNLRVVMEHGKTTMDGVRQALVMVQETADRINKLERNQFQKDVRSWLSPPDPSTNHNILRRDHLDGTTSWFTQGSTFKKWNESSSLLWIYGKPGSGKSILCSGIIQEIKSLRDAGLAHMTYFYCDFRDPKKQQVSGLLASLVAQLSAKSDGFHNILSTLYSECDAGSRQPNDDELRGCLENMLNMEGQPSIYIIIDGLDECPNDIGVVSPRERVLEQLEELVALQLSNIRICVTSRPEVDIQDSLTPLASYTVSLHDEEGQKKDIADYVRYVVHSDRMMRKWKKEHKEMVVETLSKKANGMFRWVVCQLEALRHCFPSGIRHALDELPKSLDETYDRILLGIPRERQGYARRLFQCLAESSRPFRVEELAEILAIRFDTGTLLDYDTNWRPDDPEEAILSACSSLITIVHVGASRVAQFSHFSVKEYLTSNRLANSGKHLSPYHIVPYSAHTTLAQASLTVLLALDDQVDKERMKNSPLAVYAARYWVDHAQFEEVYSGVEVAVEQLFDPARPHFSTWVWIYDIDYIFREIMFELHPTTPKAVPLYYAILCGFRDLVEHLIVTYPQDVNARGGFHTTPLHATVAKGRIDLMKLLLKHGADVASTNWEEYTPFSEAARRADLDMMSVLLDHHADVNARGKKGRTALLRAAFDGESEVAQVLLQHGAAPDIGNVYGWTPLISAARHGHPDIAGWLLESGAAVDLSNDEGWTPLWSASREGHSDIVRLLLKYGARMDIPCNDGWVPLMLASQYGHLEVVDLLRQNGAIVDARHYDGWTSLMLASRDGHLNVVRLLLKSSASVDSRNNYNRTPLALASENGHLDVVLLLLQHGATVDSCNTDGAAVNPHGNDSWTPLLAASRSGHLNVVRLLLQHHATVDSRSIDGQTALMLASRCGHLEIVHLLLQNGASTGSCDNYGLTPLAYASESGQLDIVRFLFQNGATPDSPGRPNDCNPENQNFCIALHLASVNGHLIVAEFLIQIGADTNARNQNKETPLDLASSHGKLEIVRLLLASGSNVNSRDAEDSTPLHRAAQNGHLDIVTLLLSSGAAVDIINSNNKTPFDLALDNGRLDVARSLAEWMGSGDFQGRIELATLDAASQKTIPDDAKPSLGYGSDLNIPDEWRNSLHAASEAGHLEIVRWLLLEVGADINERDKDHRTPLCSASAGGSVDVAKLLIEYGADVNSLDITGLTPLHAASRSGHVDLVQLLLDHGADVNARKQDQWTALHLAILGRSVEVVKVLLEQGADISVRNDVGHTPFRMASRRGQPDIVRLLSECGK